MTTANKMLLEKMKQEIKQKYELSNIAFSTWIEPLESISIAKDGRIDITTRKGYTDIGIKYVTKKYGMFMKDFLNDELGIKSDLRFIIMDEDKKSDPERIEKWGWLTNRQQMDSLFIGTYNRKAYSEVENFISDAYSNPSANCLLTICAEENGCGLTSMLRILQNDLFTKGNNKYIYLSAETFVDLAIQTLRSGRATSLTLVGEGESIFRDVSGIIIDDIHFIIDKSGSLKQLCDVIEKFTIFRKPVILSTNLLSKEQLLELAKEDDRFSKLLVASAFIQIEKPSREDRLQWTVHCMEKERIESDDKLAKYYIARESLRDIRIVCGALRFYGREPLDSEGYVKFSINDIHRVKDKIRTNQYMKDRIETIL